MLCIVNTYNIAPEARPTGNGRAKAKGILWITKPFKAV